MAEPRYILADHAAPVPSIYMCSSYEIVSPLWMEMVMKTKVHSYLSLQRASTDGSAQRLFDPDLYLGLRPLRVPLPFPDSHATVAVHGYNGDREQVYRALLKLFGASVVSKDHGELDVLLCATGKYPGHVPCMVTTCVSEAVRTHSVIVAFVTKQKHSGYRLVLIGAGSCRPHRLPSARTPGVARCKVSVCTCLLH